MGGGLLQLAAYGSESHYLMGNPQITFFKSVYKQHTNFSVEAIEIPMEGSYNMSDSYTAPTQLRVTLPRHGDLLSHLFLKVELPDIISSVYRKFQWVKHLGEIMVRSASISIGGQKIEELTAEWLHIYHRLHLSEGKRKLYDVMVGNTPDLFNPEMTDEAFLSLLKQHLVNANSGLNPSPEIQKTYAGLVGRLDALHEGTDTEEATREAQDSIPEALRHMMGLLEGITSYRHSNTPYYDPDDVKDGHLVPSIRGRMLYIPLPFFFNKDVGLSLPLIALQKQDVEITIEFSPMMHLFTLTNWNPRAKRYLRQRPSSLREGHKLGYFVYSETHMPSGESVQNSENTNVTLDKEAGSQGPTNSQVESEDRIQRRYNDPSFSFRPTLEAFYIFLDESERDLFAKNPHEYLIEQVTVQTSEGFHGDASQFEMKLYNPVKEMIWTLKRDDAERYNVWFDFTNHIEGGTEWQLGNLVRNPYYQLPQEALEYYSPERIPTSILKRAKLRFNGIDRFSFKDDVFLSYVQPYLYHSSTQKGIYVFSFALDPENYQPSGSVNMSMIQSVSLDFETSIPPVDPEVAMVLQGKSGNPMTAAQIRNSYGIQQGTGGDLEVTDRDIYQYTYTLNMYVINYNILKIIGGMAGLNYAK